MKNRRLGAPNTTDAIVYFCQAVDGGPIKIGIATDPKRRLAGLQNGSPVPLRMIGLILGGRAKEQELHRRFAEGRLHSEWFREDTPGLIDYINEQNGILDAQAEELRERRWERIDYLLNQGGLERLSALANPDFPVAIEDPRNHAA